MKRRYSIAKILQLQHLVTTPYGAEKTWKSPMNKAEVNCLKFYLSFKFYLKIFKFVITK